MWPDIFTEIASVLAVAAAVGVIGLWLRQPLIISFIVVGVLVGPVGFDWVHAHDQLDLFADEKADYFVWALIRWPDIAPRYRKVEEYSQGMRQRVRPVVGTVLNPHEPPRWQHPASDMCA